MNLHAWIEARLAALPEDAFDTTDDWPENAEPFDPALPGNFAAALEPITITIEYRDANGEISDRMITLLQMTGTGEGALFLAARCHKRGARRTFRIDRILSVTGLPDLPANAGPADLLRSLADLSLGATPQKPSARETALRVSKPAKRPAATRAPTPEVAKLSAPIPAAPRAAPAAKTDPDRTPFKQVRFMYRAELRLVTFLAKSDGELHPAEQGAIDRYARALAMGEGLAWADEDSQALSAYCRNLAFSAEAERASLAQLKLADAELAALFSAAMSDVMEADGRFDAAEIRMVADWGITHAPSPAEPDRDPPSQTQQRAPTAGKRSPLPVILIITALCAAALLAIYLQA